MTGGMAIYEIGENGLRRTVRVFMRPKDEKNLTDDEAEAKEAILEGFLKPKYAGKVGNAIDPFKAAEKILTERYDHSRMLEAHYEWRPNIRY